MRNISGELIYKIDKNITFSELSKILYKINSQQYMRFIINNDYCISPFEGHNKILDMITDIEINLHS